MEDAISADASKRLVPRGGDSVVRISVDDFEARVNDNVTYETHYVKTGERQEWDDKKKKNGHQRRLREQDGARARCAP